MSGGNTVGDGSGDTLWLLVDALGRLRIFDEWVTHLESDTDADDSDKSFTVSTDVEWIIQSIYIEFATSTDVGDRQIVVEIQDESSNVIFLLPVGTTQADNITRYYQLAPHLPDLTAFRDDDKLLTPLPDIILDEGYVVRIYDIEAIDADGDDLTVRMLVKQRDKES